MGQSEWEGSLGENGYVYMYDWVPLLPTWNYNIIVKQLHFDIKKLKQTTQKLKKNKIKMHLQKHLDQQIFDQC